MEAGVGESLCKTRRGLELKIVAEAQRRGGMQARPAAGADGLELHRETFVEPGGERALTAGESGAGHELMDRLVSGDAPVERTAGQFQAHLLAIDLAPELGFESAGLIAS